MVDVVVVRKGGDAKELRDGLRVLRWVEDEVNWSGYGWGKGEERRRLDSCRKVFIWCDQLSLDRLSCGIDDHFWLRYQ